MLIESLLYIMLSIRVNIAFIVIKLARFAFNPNNIYFTTIKRIYKYLKGTKNYRITYYKNNSQFIYGYYNTDYTSNLTSTKSTTSYIILLANSIISWKSKL
jgi:hypothetical protein